MIKNKEIGKIDSLHLSDYILKHYGPMSHLKLQKLLFYSDAYHLAYFGKELIEDKFEAWVHGPVSRKVYNSLRDKSILYSDLEYSDTGVDVDSEFEKLCSDQKAMLNDILSNLSEWSGFQLEAATHQEEPWRNARTGYSPGSKCNVKISKKLTEEFYKNEINEW
jgi:uncharacterized phage-associated protein